jgi:hypothetical protein
VPVSAAVCTESGALILISDGAGRKPEGGETVDSENRRLELLEGIAPPRPSSPPVGSGMALCH